MKIQKIENCREFRIYQDQVYRTDNDKRFLINHNKINEGYFSIRGMFRDLIFLFEENEFKTYIYNNRGELVELIEDYALILLNDLYDSTYFAAINDGINIINVLYNTIDLKIIKRYDFLSFYPYLIINSNLFISKNKNEIGLFNFDNEIIWEHSFNGLIESEKAFLHGEILEQSGKLFFSVAGDKLGGLFCLDVNSGMILHKFEGLVYTIFKDEEFIYTTRYENVLCKINPLTFEVEDWDVNELVKSNGFLSIQDHRCVAYNGKFYFTQTIGDTKAKLGILDTHKKELVYKYDFEPENGGIGSIQVKENRIFIHTQDNTLHIFEEE